jgi:peptidoglycan/xylan/chitin deacetylase (PgdA/CDA1 family)
MNLVFGICRWLFPKTIWFFSKEKKHVYLTFDDGPHPRITPWVLDQLKSHHAKATFFCVGNNVSLYPEVFQRILDEGHTVGNHTYHHQNGFSTATKVYLDSIEQASTLIPGKLFRPPYGRITPAQFNKIKTRFTVVFWNVLAYDFNQELSPETCYKNLKTKINPGAVVVFHDSEKAWKRLEHVLPKVLHDINSKGLLCESLNEKRLSARG